MDPFGFVHGGTIPVHACLFVPPGGAGAPVAPYLAGALGDPDRMGCLGEVHALLVQQTHVLLALRRAHQLPRRIFDAVERPTAFPATVFVSVAPGHLTLLAVGHVLQRSLELALHATKGRMNGATQRSCMADELDIPDATELTTSWTKTALGDYDRIQRQSNNSIDIVWQYSNAVTASLSAQTDSYRVTLPYS